MPKPTIGQGDWGTALNDFLDTKASLVGGRVQEAELPEHVAEAALSASYAGRRDGTRKLRTPRTLVTSGSHNGFPFGAVAANGDFVVVYRNAAQHEGTKGVFKRIVSTDKGATFGAATDAYVDATYDVRDPALTRLSDDRIALSFFVYDHTGGTALVDGVRVAFSSDNGATFAAPVTVDSTFTLWAAAAGQIVELADGTLLLPVYGRDTGDTLDSSRLMVSINGGATWTQRAVIATGTRHYQETNVAALPDGRLIALMRSDTAGAIYRSISSDNGISWSAPTLGFAGSGAPRITVRGDVLHVLYRSTAATQNPITRVSTDNGETWGTALQFDTASAKTHSNYGHAIPFGRDSLRYLYGVENTVAGSLSDVMLVDAFSPTDEASAERIAAKGALLAGTAEESLGVLPVASVNGRKLVADSSTETGLRWSGVCGVRCFNTANVSVANNTVTALTWGSEDFDTDAFHTLGASQLTVPAGRGGIYLVTGTVYYAANATGVRQARIHKNGSVVRGGLNIGAASSGEVALSAATTLALVPGDVIELAAYQNSGGALDVRQESSGVTLTLLDAYV